MIGINAGSGQRPFRSTPECQWVNVDIQERWNPDILGSWTSLPMYTDNSIDLIVSHHSLEHVVQEEADAFVKEAHRILRQSGSLIVIVPDPKAISMRYAYGQVDDVTFNFLTYGAFMGHESDRHKVAYSPTGLVSYLQRISQWREVKPYDWRTIPGADVAAWDWWFHGCEAIK
jgi:hypothetical protein